MKLLLTLIFILGAANSRSVMALDLFKLNTVCGIHAKEDPAKLEFCNFLSIPKAALSIQLKDGSIKEMDLFNDNNNCGRWKIFDYDQGYENNFSVCLAKFKPYLQLGKISIVPPVFKIKNLTSDCYEKNLSIEIINKCIQQQDSISSLKKLPLPTCEEVTEEYVICNNERYVKVKSATNSLSRTAKKIEDYIENSPRDSKKTLHEQKDSNGR